MELNTITSKKLSGGNTLLPCNMNGIYFTMDNNKTVRSNLKFQSLENRNETKYWTLCGGGMVAGLQYRDGLMGEL